MKSPSIQSIIRPIIVVGLCLTSATAASQASGPSKTVLGPQNPDLYHGANALLAGDGEEGVRLTLLGLERATNARERTSARSNLCAGYVVLKQLEIALAYCNEALADDDRYWRAYSNRALVYIKLGRLEEAEQDLQQAEALAANAHTVKLVRSVLLDVTNPVAPEIVIDDRRQPADEQDD